MSQLSKGAQHVQAVLQEKGFSFAVVELPESTRTAAEAATAVGCTVGQIAKSLVFRTKDGQHPILVIASGSNRVSEEKVSALVGQAIEKADADYVQTATGFTIGGVPPVGHTQPLQTLVDQDLLAYSEIWAAAGGPHAVFKLTPDDLVKMTNGKVDTTC